MSLTALAKKLRLQDATRAVVINAPSGYVAELGGIGLDVHLEIEQGAKHDFAQLFVSNREELDKHIKGAWA